MFIIMFESYMPYTGSTSFSWETYKRKTTREPENRCPEQKFFLATCPRCNRVSCARDLKVRRAARAVGTRRERDSRQGLDRGYRESGTDRGRSGAT